MFIVEGGRVKFVPVGKGITGGMMIEITSGLQEGQEIVTGPYASLRELKDGVLIKPEDEEGTTTPHERRRIPSSSSPRTSGRSTSSTSSRSKPCAACP